MKLYMAVTADKYELPLAVSEKAVDLAERFNVDVNTIYQAVHRNSSGKYNKIKFIKVIFE